MKKQTFFAAFGSLLAVSFIVFFSIPQVFSQDVKVFKNEEKLHWARPKFDSTKQTVVILAENAGTELFDLMAPFYLFSATEKANVFIVSEQKAPILLVNSLFILPHFSFSELDSAQIQPDVIVIPNLTVHLKSPPKLTYVNWVKNHYTGSNIILSICDGSATAAATGIYDGQPLTTHASDYAVLKKKFPKTEWVTNISVTSKGNLYSTAGVSNAVEGSLTVISRLFGKQTMYKVLQDIRYPHAEIKVDHQSNLVNKKAMTRIGSKMLFRKNRKIGVLLCEDVNEFELASVLDTYVRSFPKSINSMSINGNSVTSRHGLTLYPTEDYKAGRLNELHVIQGEGEVLEPFRGENIVQYGTPKSYPIDACIARIQSQYGKRFAYCVKLMLDYN